MNGATWSERRQDWWLASNGRWYAPENYPGGWSTTALPPAPEHRERRSAAAMITSRTKKLRASVSDALEDASERAEWAGSSRTGRPPPPPPSTGSAAAHTSGGVASATVTSSSSYASRLPAGMPTTQAIGAAEDDYPDPPGRFTDDDDDAPDRIA